MEVHDAGKVHDAAGIFPLDEEHLDELAADIKAHGQLVPIETLDGLILDGRRRYMACIRAGIKPKFQPIQVADPISHVLSLNLHRRHLDVSQQGMVAARAREFFNRQAKERQKAAGGDRKSSKAKSLPKNSSEAIRGDARDQAAAAVGVSGFTVDQATKVLASENPELIAAVDAGTMAVSKAAKIAVLVPESQAAELAAHRNGEPRPHTLAGQVLAYLRECGTEGATREEATDALGMQADTLRARWVDLADKGFIKDTGRKRPNVNGRQVEVFTATNSGSKPQEASNGTTWHEGNGKRRRLPVGIFRADDAINALKTIPRDDPLRAAGFRKVRDWMRRNK